MPIFVNSESKEFHIQTKDSSYIFTVLQNNQLGQLYYGQKIHHRNSFSHLLTLGFRAALTNPYVGDYTFSLETLKQEYPSYGTTDFRQPAIQILQKNGSRISNFEYNQHKIYAGKPKLKGLPATYVENEEEATTLEISLFDHLIKAEIILFYTVYENLNVITRSVKLINQSNDSFDITNIMSASVDFPDSNFVMLQLSGAWGRERYVKERELQSGIQSISSTRGTSSSQQNPFIALRRPNTDEHHGEVYGFSFVYSGNFLAQVEVDHYNVSRVMMGINPFDFNWLLEPKETFQAPEVVMVYSNKGINGMSQTYHKLYRERLVRGKWRDLERPVLVNNWEGTYFDFNEEKILDLARISKQQGVELFVLDDGWFGKRNNDTTSLGDWFVNKEKLPNGITGLSRKINQLGLEFGLWFEPEMVSKESNLFENHPDWIIHVPKRNQSHGRHQYVLDFSRTEVVDYIYEMMAKILREASVSYVKWDMNRYMTEIGSANLPANRQKEVGHRYILGVYNLYERLTSEFPDILFESCASGGARFDPGMLYYSPQGWTSDNTDAIERLKIQYGTSIVYPISSMGAHVSAVPNHQVGRITSLETRANVAYFGTFGYELDVTKMDNSELEQMKEQISFYKRARELIQKGTFYRLVSPFKNDGNITSWIVVSEDLTEAIAGYYQVMEKPNSEYSRLQFQGLDKDLLYCIEGMDKQFYGDELMNVGLYLTDKMFNNNDLNHPGDFKSRLFKLTSI